VTLEDHGNDVNARAVVYSFVEGETGEGQAEYRIT
jgi:hypothetical protein